MANTNELKYSKSHEWVRYEGDEAYIGITDFAQSSMGDLVFVNLPEVDDEIEVGEALGDIESVKAGFRNRSGSKRRVAGCTGSN